MSYLGCANPFYHPGHIMRGYLVASPRHCPIPIEPDVCVTQDNCCILWHDANPNDTVGMSVRLP